MKTYKVSVGEKEYIVKLEEVAEGTTLEPTTSTIEKTATSGDAETVEAPLQGTLMKINIASGQEVKAGDVVLIIEAMKLENEVVAPRDGVIEQVFVKEGDSVNAEDALYSLI